MDPVYSIRFHSIYFPPSQYNMNDALLYYSFYIEVGNSRHEKTKHK